MLFSCEYGEVSYFRYDLQGNCGIQLVYNVGFFIKTKQNGSMWLNPIAGYRRKLYKAFQKHLIEELKDYKRNKVIMTDAINGESGRRYPSIYGFCRANKWHEGQHTFNQNSNHYIVVFEYSLDGSLRKKD